jgi:hypothetical protein
VKANTLYLLYNESGGKMKKTIAILILLTVILAACVPSETTIKTTLDAAVPQTQAALSSLAPVPTDTPIPTVLRTPTPKVTFAPTGAPIPSSDTPGSAGTPISDGKSRDNPIQIHQQLELTINHEQDFNITIVEVKRGKDAWKDIYGINIYNPRAPADEEYVLAIIEVNYLKGPTDKTLQITPFDFGSVTNNVVLPIKNVVLDPDFFKAASKGLAAGAKAYGLVAFLVFKDDPNPLIYFGNPNGGNAWYFATNKIINSDW